MDITGLDILQISEKIYPYVTDYFKGCKLSDFKEWSFESYIFNLSELTHLIPAQHQHRFKDTDKFNGASGFLDFETVPEDYENKKFLLMTITDEDNTKIYFLYVQELNEDYDKQSDILIADFMT